MVSRTKESAPARDWLSVAARYSPSGHGRHRVLSVAVGRITYCSTQSHVRIAIFRFHLSSFTHCRVCVTSQKNNNTVYVRAPQYRHKDVYLNL
jgi:hypothetical protein